MRGPLPYKEGIEPPEHYHTGGTPEKWLAVLFYDPTELYVYLGDLIEPRKRLQSGLTMAHMWPNRDNRCACGCGIELTGRKTRWADTSHSWSANKIFEIIYGRTETIHSFLRRYYGNKCASCDGRYALEVDHITPVKHNGGGGWLSNYQLLCGKCHRDKTNKDFGWKQPLQTNQLSIKL